MAIETDADGNETQYAYNADNQVWCSVDPAETAAGVTCPAISPPSSIPSASYPGTTINVYSASDELIAVIDPLGNVTTHLYTSGVSGVPNGSSTARSTRSSTRTACAVLTTGRHT